MYSIILYNKGKRVKNIGKYEKYKEALVSYENILNENKKVLFHKQSTWDGKETDFELVLTAPKKNSGKDFFRNDLGALVKIKTKGSFVVKRISRYYIEEVFTDKLNDVKIDFKGLVKTLLSGNDNIKAVYPIRNKLVIEDLITNELNLYILKNRYDSKRLFSVLKKFMIINRFTNFSFFNQPSYDNKMRLYEILTNKYNIDRRYMHRVSTR
jgi:hypothetical protein